MKKVISGMKLLQDNLGTYQDLHVQQEMLPAFLKDLKVGPAIKEETEKAIYFLTEHFKQEEEKVRKEFSSVFKQFNSNEIRSYFTFISGVEFLTREQNRETGEKEDLDG